MPIDELVEALKPFGIDAVDLDMLQRGDKLDKAGAKFSAAMERLLAERDEAVNWIETVERHGTDGFDALADTWLAMEAIKPHIGQPINWWKSFGKMGPSRLADCLLAHHPQGIDNPAVAHRLFIDVALWRRAQHHCARSRNGGALLAMTTGY